MTCPVLRGAASRGTHWPAAELAEAQALWRIGTSAGVISDELNVRFHAGAPIRSSNSVISKMHRTHTPTPATQPARHRLTLATLREREEERRRIDQVKREQARAMAEKKRDYAVFHIAAKQRPAHIKTKWEAKIDRYNAALRRIIPDRGSIADELRAQPWHPLRDAKPEWLLRGRGR